MKLQLTENQIKNLMWRLDEQDTPTTGDTTTQTNSGGGIQGSIDSYANLMTDLAMSLFSKTSGRTDNTTSTDSQGTGETAFALNIPPGMELMHPLGPQYKVSSGFGMRNIGGSASKNHKGVDITAPVGTAVYAPQDGTVVRAADTSPNGCGGFVKLHHTGLNVHTKFCHLSKWVVKSGDQVKKGQLIGYTGGKKGAQYAGNSTGPHLHYEVIGGDGLAMNPTKVHSNMA